MSSSYSTPTDKRKDLRTVLLDCICSVFVVPLLQTALKYEAVDAEMAVVPVA